jgi:hypothetical protein
VGTGSQGKQYPTENIGKGLDDCSDYSLFLLSLLKSIPQHIKQKEVTEFSRTYLTHINIPGRD